MELYSYFDEKFLDVAWRSRSINRVEDDFYDFFTILNRSFPAKFKILFNILSFVIVKLIVF